MAVKQHEAQIFFARGFDDAVLRVKSLGSKPVQNLGEHRELVQAGGHVHCAGSIISVLCLSSFDTCVVLQPIRMPQCEDQVGELAPL